MSNHKEPNMNNPKDRIGLSTGLGGQTKFVSTPKEAEKKVIGAIPSSRPLGAVGTGTKSKTSFFPRKAGTGGPVAVTSTRVPVTTSADGSKRPVPSEPQKAAFSVVSSKEEAGLAKRSKGAEEQIPGAESDTSVMATFPAVTLRSAAGQVWEDPTMAEWDPSHFRIFVGDLGPEVTDVQLQQAFSRYASLSKARVVRDRRSNKSKGYGFVSFAEAEDFLRAIREMHGKYIGSRPVKLKRSTWTERAADSASYARQPRGKKGK